MTTLPPAQRQPRQDPRRRRRRRGRRRRQGRRARAAAPTTSPTAYGRQLRPLLADPRASPARPARRSRLPDRRRASTPPLLVLVGPGRRRADPVAVRRAAGVAARVGRPTPPRSPWRCRADTPELVGRRHRGLPARRLHLHRLQARHRQRGRPARRRSVVLSADRPPGRGGRTPSRRPRSSPTAVARHPRLGQHAARRPDAHRPSPTPSPAVHKDATKGRGAPKVTITVLDEQAARRAGLRRHPRRRRRLRRRRRGWSSSATRPKGAAHAPRPGRQGHHLRLRRPHHQARRRAWTTMKCDMAGAAAVVAGDLAIARLGLPVKVTHLRADGREHGLGHAPCVPATCSRCTAARTVEVPNTDAEGRLVLADALVARHRGEARRDPRRRHADRPHGRSRSATRSRGVMGTDDVVAARARGRRRRRRAASGRCRSPRR